MNMPIHIAAGGLEGVFWLIVVIISIGAQIAKANRRASRQGPPPAGADPGEELRKFLEAMGGRLEPPATPPAPPAPTARQPRPATPPLPSPTPRPRTAPARSVTPSPAPVMDAKPLRAVAQPSPARARIEPRGRWSLMLHDKPSLVQAFILREILQPPPALRNPQHITDRP